MSNSGKKMDNVDSGSIRVEKNNNRIVANNADGIPTILIGDLGNNKTGIRVSRDGYDVFTASDDELIMSSDFNMYKIIAGGELSVAPRNSSITLSGSNIGYVFSVSIYLNDYAATTGNVMLNVYGSGIGGKINILNSGTFYNDGTNKVEYNYHYKLEGGILNILFNLRLISGSFIFNPYSYFVGALYWEISNQTYYGSGAGGGATGDGKYYYLDSIVYNEDGTVKTSLSSSLEEFVGGASNYFPRPMIAGVVGFKIP